MRKQDIEIVISPTGEVSFTVKGVKGASCIDETKSLEQADARLIQFAEGVVGTKRDRDDKAGHRIRSTVKRRLRAQTTPGNGAFKRRLETALSNAAFKRRFQTALDFLPTCLWSPFDRVVCARSFQAPFACASSRRPLWRQAPFKKWLLSWMVHPLSVALQL